MFSSQNAGGGSLFGNTQNKPQGSIFGNPASGQPGGLFGNAANQSSGQQQQNTSLFGSTNQQPQQPNAGNFFGSTTNQNPAQNQQQQSQQGGLINLQSRGVGTSSIWNPNASLQPREKSIQDQMITLIAKWHPESPDCNMSYYFYNNVPPEHVPYYGPSVGEDERKWEDALNNKPSEGSIPVLARGFAAITQRLVIQTHAVSALQSRLHEINNSLSAMMQNHDLVISVRTADARRKHAALSQRCLSLAAKVQVLRNRGYALDGAEEELKKKLREIEKGAFDPVLNGRQEEIWARMSGVRARARFLQEEFEKTGRAMAQQDEEEILDEENMKTVKKLLGDYDAQLQHLKTELEYIKKEQDEWQSTQEAVHGGQLRR